MKLFISWSGEESKKVAEYLYEWIPQRLQAVNPWASFNSDNLPQGKNNINRIFESARKCDLCLLILTKKSLKSPWVSFEPGIFEGGEKEILALLCDGLKHEELHGYPFSGYHAYPTKESIITLFKTINKNCSDIDENLFVNGVSKDFDEFLKMYNDVFSKKIENNDFDNHLYNLTCE